MSCTSESGRLHELKGDLMMVKWVSNVTVITGNPGMASLLIEVEQEFDYGTQLTEIAPIVKAIERETGCHIDMRIKRRV